MLYNEAHKELSKMVSSWYQKTGRGIFQDLEWHGNLVHIVHEDGTTLCYRDAVIVDIDQQWIGVITEHYGYHIFDKGDLLVFDTFQRNYENWTLEDLRNIYDNRS